MAELHSHRDGSNLILSISNPEHRNALDPVMYTAGVQALEQAGADPDVGAVILAGEGQMFCAGGNLQRLRGNREQPPQVQADSIDQLARWIEAIRACPKPVLAAVEGAAAGAGFSLVLACDLVVAARNAIFVMAYSNVALSPDGGASWHLARALPRQTAMELLLCGNRTDAPRLHELGLINRLCDPGQALETASQWGSRLGLRAPNAGASIKELVNTAGTHTLRQQLELERDHFVRNLHHANAGIAIDAFLAREKPIYQKTKGATPT